ncbi:MAG: hypothetical protein JNK38_06715 [Acidobacteria bacterium]|nr:hypothetical protein [Acidobacteriota bacterium]
MAILMLLLLWNWPVIPAFQSTEVEVTGTKVKLTPPSSLKPANQFPGFFDEETNVSIMVTEMPAPYSEVIKTFTKESLATKNISLISKEDVSIGGIPGQLLHVRQLAQLYVLKWIVITGNDKEVVLIVGTFPEALKSQWSLPIRKSVLSARWNATAKTDPWVGLPFVIQDAPELKFAKRMSSAVALTTNGELPGKPNNDPLFIVAPAISRVTVADQKEFAEKRLYQHEGVSITRIKHTAEVMIAGLRGYEIVAEGKQTKPPLGSTIIYQTMLFDDDSYFLMVGFAPADKENQYLEIFRRVSRTFRKQ